jgi:hypothetical protein
MFEDVEGHPRHPEQGHPVARGGARGQIARWGRESPIVNIPFARFRAHYQIRHATRSAARLLASAAPKTYGKPRRGYAGNALAGGDVLPRRVVDAA